MNAITDTLQLLQRRLAPQRRIVREGDRIYPVGKRFDSLYVVHAGIVKLVSLAADGREQLAGLRLKGDWLGFDGLAGGTHQCDAVALDTGEVWTLRYDSLLQACVDCPPLLQALNAAMSEAIGLEHERIAAQCGLPADGRVADFLRRWADALSRRGLRSDLIDLHLTRAEIGQHLGITLESVSRALSRLVREQLISFPEKCRREVRIPDVAALAGFVRRTQAGELEALQ